MFETCANIHSEEGSSTGDKFENKSFNNFEWLIIVNNN